MESLLTLSAAIKHSIGNRVLPLNSSAAVIANRALEFICNAHSWTWLHQDLSVNFTADQDWADLPENLVQVRSLRAKANTARHVIPCSLDEIATFRQLSSSTGGSIYWSLAWDPSSPVVPYLEIFPTPQTTESAALQGFYLRRVPDLVNDSDVPQIPSHFHGMLRQFCRAFALSEEEERQSVDLEIAMKMLEDAKQKDGLGMPVASVLCPQVWIDEEMGFNDRARFFPWQGVG